jgi:hypothetical protein
LAGVPAFPGAAVKRAAVKRGGPQSHRAAQDAGYSLGSQAIHGRALLTPQTLGIHLVYKLKDSLPVEEIAFWGGVLARLAPPKPWAFVTHAPSSGKRPDSEHLATLLARYVAGALELPFCGALQNLNPRGNRGSRDVKLLERIENPFAYARPAGLGAGVDVLIVDDVIFTRSTAMRCVEAVQAGGDAPFMLVLYRA